MNTLSDTIESKQLEQPPSAQNWPTLFPNAALIGPPIQALDAISYQQIRCFATGRGKHLVDAAIAALNEP